MLQGTTVKLVWGSLSPLGATVAILTLSADQLNKWWMISVYQIGEKGKVVLTPFLDLVLVWNQGISYGLFPQGGLVGQAVLIGVAAAAVLALAYWLARAERVIAAVSMGLIAGGAIGNAIDRGLYGAVADFFSLHAFGFYWYIFNIADVAIVAGVAGLLYETLVLGHKMDSKSP